MNEPVANPPKPVVNPPIIGQNGLRNRSYSHRSPPNIGRKINNNQTNGRITPYGARPGVNPRPKIPQYRGDDDSPSSSSSSSDSNHHKPWGNLGDWDFEKKNPVLNTQSKLYKPG